MLVATKGGHQRCGTGSWTVNGDPAHLEQAAKESAKRVGVEAIGLYQFHRPDPSVRYADSIGAIRDLLDEGVILMADISSAPVDQIDGVNEILSSLRELERCAELGIAFLPWSPLGGIANAPELSARHVAFREVADEAGVSVYFVTLAWELALTPVVVPIAGFSRPESIRDSAAATGVMLTSEQISRLSAA